MKQVLGLLAVFLSFSPSTPAAEKPIKILASGLKTPRAVAVGGDGKVYATVAGTPGKDGGGAVFVVDQGKAVPFATGLDDPRGLAAYLEWLFVADRQRVWRIGRGGKAEVFAAASAFPSPPQLLNNIVADPESGTLYVADVGDGQGKGAAVYRVSPKGKVNVVTDGQRWPALRVPAGLALDGASHLLLVDAGTGELHRIKLGDGSTEKLADGLGGGSGLAWDNHGRLFASDDRGGRVFGISQPGAKPVPLVVNFQAPASLCLDLTGHSLLVLDVKAGNLAAIPTAIPGAEVDDTPLAVETEVAFPNLQWDGWKAENDKGQVVPLRPLVLTHAGDGGNRIFVATQRGVIHVFPNDQKATKTRVFLDIQDRVKYNDNTNEEGFLGLAFHPNYKKNGEFFAFYTTKKAGLTNILARFRVSRDDPNRADPASEEEILRITKPFWNHDGGTLCFGPDGYLYVAVGDGGAANDPFGNGQNMKALLGKVLRIDVDHKDPGKNYAIPRDNPFVNQPDVRPEVWAYGLRNIWRMAFDRKTGALWAADVGQNLFEEINLVTRGGNFGWNRREGLHPFGFKGRGVGKDLIEPIWEYNHSVGKSITGGVVYRGARLPELEGAYLYADYITAKIWALRYDSARKRVVANRPISDRKLPILSFGEDEKGEVYLLTYVPPGKGIYWLVPSGKGKAKD